MFCLSIMFYSDEERPLGAMGLLPDTYGCRLRMRWECRERFSWNRLQRKLLVKWSWHASRHVVGRSRYSRQMRNPQFYVSDKRPIAADNIAITTFVWPGKDNGLSLMIINVMLSIMLVFWLHIPSKHRFIKVAELTAMLWSLHFPIWQAIYGGYVSKAT